MEFFSHQSRFDFLKISRWTAVCSVVLCVLALWGVGTRGLHWGLEFTGGIMMDVSHTEPLDLEALRLTLEQDGYPDAVVQHTHTLEQAMVRLRPTGDLQATAEHLKHMLQTTWPGIRVDNLNAVGAHVGSDMMARGALAVVVAFLLTGVYISFRFERRLAWSAALALAHDPVLIVGVFAWSGVVFDLASLAGVLAVVGYSLNDTIVVFDRIRENFKQTPRSTPAVEVVNLAINHTLSRTVMTSVATLLVVSSLLVWGGTTLLGFAMALMVGIVTGTYSSIYVAGTLAVYLGLSREQLIPPASKGPASGAVV